MYYGNKDCVGLQRPYLWHACIKTD